MTVFDPMDDLDADRMKALEWAANNLGHMPWPSLPDSHIGAPLFHHTHGSWRLVRSLLPDNTDGPIVFANCLARAITEEEVRSAVVTRVTH